MLDIETTECLASLALTPGDIISLNNPPSSDFGILRGAPALVLETTRRVGVTLALIVPASRHKPSLSRRPGGNISLEAPRDLVVAGLPSPSAFYEADRRLLVLEAAPGIRRLGRLPTRFGGRLDRLRARLQAFADIAADRSRELAAVAD